MPITTPRPSKRKHADGDPSGSTGKKTKEERRAEKRAKREAEAESPAQNRFKSSQGSVAPVAVPDLSGAGTEFKLVRARVNVSVPPRFVGDTRRGVQEILDNLLMR